MEEMYTDSIESGAEELEFADPEGVEGAEETEFADPSEPEARTDADSAFAELRRRAEEAERRAQAAEANSAQMQDALGLYFEGENPMDLAINAQANAYGVAPDEVRARFEAEQARNAFEVENNVLRSELNQIKVEQMMAQGLSDIKAIDPDINDLTELGEEFPRYIAAGLSSTDAYWACKAKEMKTKINPPKPIGSVNSSSMESGFFTKDEVDSMSDADIQKNYDAIMSSMSKWK